MFSYTCTNAINYVYCVKMGSNWILKKYNSFSPSMLTLEPSPRIWCDPSVCILGLKIQLGGWQWCVCVLSHVWPFATPWTIDTHQAPLSMDFSRQEYWGRLSFPAPADLSDPGSESASPALADRVLTTVPPGKPSGVKMGKRSFTIWKARVWLALASEREAAG